MGYEGAPFLPADLTLVLCAKPGRTAAESAVMMARLHPSGIFELLSAGAWARTLGYLPEELSGKTLRQLIAVDSPDAGSVVSALLNPVADAPLDVALRCKDERRKCFRFHRRVDPRGESIFLVADELT